MRVTIRSFISLISATVLVAGCTDSTAPVPIGDRWALVSIDGVALPAAPAAFSSDYRVVADTLQFGVSSSVWNASPLAVAKRVVRRNGGPAESEEWWFTYESGEPLRSPFSIRALCADGDLSLASCIDGRGQATMDRSLLTISFNVSQLGVLRYQRVPTAMPD